MSPIITIDTDNAVIRLYLDAVRAAGITDDGIARLQLDAQAIATAVGSVAGCTFRVLPIVASAADPAALAAKSPTGYRCGDCGSTERDHTCRREPRPVGDDPEIEDGIRPWDRATCTLVGIGRTVAVESLWKDERLCDRCWGDRPKCGGYPRKDGRR